MTNEEEPMKILRPVILALAMVGLAAVLVAGATDFHSTDGPALAYLQLIGY
jgi:hypothetical protein